MTKNLDVVKITPVGHTPVDIVKAENKFFVANRFSNTISVLDQSLNATNTVKVSREPMALAVAKDKVFVANHLTDGKANVNLVGTKVDVINTVSLNVSSIAMPNGSTGVRDIAVSTNGDYLYVTAILSRYMYPVSQLDRGWMTTQGIVIINAATNSLKASVILDDINNGAANPYGIICEDNKIYVALSGTYEVMVVDETEMLNRISMVENGEYEIQDKKIEIEDIPDYFNFLAGTKKRYSSIGEGLNGGVGTRYITLNNGFVYSTEYFSGSIGVLYADDINAVEGDDTLAEYFTNLYDNENLFSELKAKGVKEFVHKDSINLYQKKERVGNDSVRMGEIYWYDATNTFQQWQSCNSCHPDVRNDALNWDVPGDGLGNAKQTASVIYSHRTPPVLTIGAEENAEADVITATALNGISDPKVADYINDFLRAQKPLASPALNRDGTLTSSAQKGKNLFVEYSCNTCHYGSTFTDTEPHLSDTLNLENDSWEDRPFYTPTLVEVWRTAPYFFNGSAATLKEAVEHRMKSSPKVTNSANNEVNREDLTNLTDYVMSIGDDGELLGVEQVFFKNKNGETKINKMFAGSTMQKLTIRSQYKFSNDAYIRISLHDKHGNLLQNGIYVKLRAMDVGEQASISLNYKIPNDMPSGSYYKIDICQNLAGNKIATEFKGVIQYA